MILVLKIIPNWIWMPTGYSLIISTLDEFGCSEADPSWSSICILSQCLPLVTNTCPTKWVMKLRTLPFNNDNHNTTIWQRTQSRQSWDTGNKGPKDKEEKVKNLIVVFCSTASRRPINNIFSTSSSWLIC